MICQHKWTHKPLLNFLMIYPRQSYKEPVKTLLANFEKLSYWEGHLILWMDYEKNEKGVCSRKG